MKTFEGIAFLGTFRDYQQKVLADFGRHMEDKRIHIVAAPGSGKTILGLEIIRRLTAPALILSPSIVIRQQWSQRFAESFLPPGGDIGDYCSCSLRDPGLLTSVTYQSIHSAYTRQIEERDEDDEETGCAQTDYSDFDLIGAVRAAGVKTICLDEAHHLKAEWQKSLEGFIAAVQGEMNIVALTATPPYDSTPGEWKRYCAVCGEIDEEIAVPELVQQRTLCPHQDYIYFNYPTREEADKVKSFREQALTCVREIISGEAFGAALSHSRVLTDYRGMEELLTENARGFIAVLALAKESNIEIPARLARMLVPGGRLPAARLSFAETAFQFIIDNPELFSAEASQSIRKALSKGGFYEKKKVGLQYNERPQRMLISSNGKLESIKSIVAAESAQMGGALRLLILTDYIRKDMMDIVGTQEPIGIIGTVTVFEAVRRMAAEGVRVALLSGGLVILPNDTLEAVRALSERSGIGLETRPIAGTAHSEARFGGANKHKVAVLTEAFEAGHIHVLVGTKALLGEGWDSPCINSLILASFVGSFVLTNQMRGRAIRMDKNDPEKTANIWHLVTVEPEYGLKALLGGVLPQRDCFASHDFETLERRFECFLAPAYERDIIQSGIERVGIIRPPFDRAGFARINTQMLSLAAQRGQLKAKWASALSGPMHPEVLEVAEVPPQVVPRAFIFTSVLYETLLGIALYIIVRGIATSAFSTGSLLYAAAGFAAIWLFTAGFGRLLRYISPRKTIQTLSSCILETLKEMGEVRSLGATADIVADPTGQCIQCGILGATLHEKKVFADAMKELLTAIDNPRYLLIKKARLLFFTLNRYGQSYACPSVIGVRQENVDKLMRHLKRASGAFGFVYTRNEAGRQALLRCRRRSYINRNEMFVKGRKVVRSRWE